MSEPEEKLPSISLADHYTEIVTPTLKDPEAFFSYRYFTEQHYFHRKFDELTPEKKELLRRCPKPRITSFNQGSVFFPYSERKEVLKMISYDVMADCTIYWNQIAYDIEDEGCRLVVDIDSDTRVLSNLEINKIARVLWKTLKEYYTDFETNPIDIFVAKCGPRIKKGHLSTGVHIIAHVRVSIQQAQQIIYGYQLRIQHDKSLDMTGLVIDGAIYKEKSKQCSARMIYCNKIEKCPMCQDNIEQRQGCKFCDKLGEVISRSTYEPMSCLQPHNGNHEPAFFQKKNPDFFTLIQNYSIWPEEIDGTHHYEKPTTDPVYQPETKTKTVEKRQSASLGKGLKKIRVSDPAYQLLEEFIHGLVWNGKAWWDRVIIDNIALTENERIAWVYVSGIGSSVCPYAMRDHDGNRIWFSITRGGKLTCYCHSKKEEYGCQKKDRIQFEVPGFVTQKIFGIAGQPSLNQTADKNFTFDEFLKRQPKTNEQQIDRVEEARQNHLKRVSDFYELKFSDGEDKK